MSEVRFTVPNISCGHCVHTIKMELGDMEGVLQVEASESSKEVKIQYEPPATSERIVALLEEINYAPA